MRPCPRHAGQTVILDLQLQLLPLRPVDPLRKSVAMIPTLRDGCPKDLSDRDYCTQARRRLSVTAIAKYEWTSDPPLALGSILTEKRLNRKPDSRCQLPFVDP